MAGPRYIADPPEAVRRVELDGLTAWFHRPSGITHILAPPAPQILEVLAGRPGSLAEILARLAEAYDIDGAEAELQPRLDELEAAGLVSRCSPAKAGAQEEPRAGPRLSPGNIARAA
ncbi:MAG TPA: HPr-rel-A system PqqD family peptide chaperone [Allosphingosinicella sp.]|nr:HPr-rel-A system PqqD family peptide chaperone [Allosphingosinicella sp.]